MNQKIAQIIAKASADENFKKELIANPNQVLTDNGISIPDNVKVVVLQDTLTTKHLVLPHIDANDIAGGNPPNCQLGIEN